SGSFDHLVGDGEQCWRQRKSECAGRLCIDDELEFGRLRDRQVGWLRALEDAASVEANPAHEICNARGITHKPPNLHVVSTGIDCREPMPRGECSDLNPTIGE